MVESIHSVLQKEQDTSLLVELEALRPLLHYIKFSL